MLTLSERVAWAIKTIEVDKNIGKGIGTLELAKRLGVSDKTLSKYKKGEGDIKGGAIDVLIKDFKFNSEWLFSNQGEPFPGAQKKDEYKDVCGPGVVGTGVPSINETAADYDDFIFIPQMSDQISAGGGVLPYNNVEMRVAFRGDWIKRKGDPQKMSLIKVVGDSMEPTLLSGDLVLVDHGRTRVDPQGGIYAIAIDHEIMIKRIQPLHYMGTLKIISDNKSYGSIEADAERVNINGKVIWFARDIER